MRHQPVVLSLPIADRRASFAFYRDGLDFEPVGEPADDGVPEPLQFALNDGLRIMLVPTGGFGWITGEHEVAPRGVSECVLAIGAASDEEVDSKVRRAEDAGASVITEPGPQPWGYAGAFADLDGHVWMVRSETASDQGGPSPSTVDTPEAEELRRLVLERVAAVHAKDPEPLAAAQAPDVVTFDVLPPLRSRGSDAVDEKARAWFDAYSGDIGYEVRDLEVAVGGDVGFCSFVYHVTGTLAAGGEVDMWVRATLGCRRIDGRWLITHDHESVPFDPQSGKALIDLEP